jgi:opacity protein-like surface antigen
MKKMMLLCALILCTATVSNAQESRQEASVSFIGVFAPAVFGLVVHPMTTSMTGGMLASYRYELTPRSAVEMNYTFAQDTLYYNSSAFPQGAVHTMQQELSGAYVYSRTYKRFSPFGEGGGGAVVFIPILDYGTHELPTKTQMELGFLFGGGFAIELSPSFDLRAEFRGFLMKTPDYGQSFFNTNRYYVAMTPAVGFTYHF